MPRPRKAPAPAPATAPTLSVPRLPQEVIDAGNALGRLGAHPDEAAWIMLAVASGVENLMELATALWAEYQKDKEIARKEMMSKVERDGNILRLPPR